MPEAARRRQLLDAAFSVAVREGVGGLTVRAVAQEAEVSHGLVLFHFGRKELLMAELLEWLIDDMEALHVSDDLATFPRSLDQLHAVLQQEMSRLSRQPEHTRLFLEFWAAGLQNAAIRDRISDELARYRAVFRTIMEAIIRSDPSTFAGVTAEGLSAVAVSWIHGCAVQTMVDPDFGMDAYLTAVRSMIGRLS